MNSYSIALFLHILGALGFFIVLGLEWIGLAHARRVTLSGEVRTILETLKSTNRLGFASMLTTVVTGVYMMLTVWRGVAWIWVVLGSLVLEIVLFVALTGPRMAAIERALAAEKGPVSLAFNRLLNDPILRISIQTRTAIIVGIVFLKIAKPALGGALLAISAAIVLGLASTLPLPGRARAHQGSAD